MDPWRFLIFEIYTNFFWGDNMETFLTILLDGLQFSSYLFIVSAGLTIIFGVMKILNVAHGSFYAWGAYTSAFFIGKFSDMGLPDALGFLIIVAAAIVVGVILGFIIEQGILKHMYERDEVLIVLATFGLFLVLEDIILIAFGTDPYFAYQPMALLESVELGGITRDVYGITLIGVAAVVAVGCWWLLNKTKWGTLLKAVIFDREMGISMGINVPLVYTLTFIGGAILGGLGGAYIAPTISVAPGLGAEVIVLSFAVVVVGGMGSIAGAAIGSLIIGLLRAIAVHEVPQVELFVVFAVMAIVLVFRPEGLFAPAKTRKI
jgi:branched-chain amino acid transport system permease protein